MGDAVFVQSDRVNIRTGTIGMVGLVAYTGGGQAPPPGAAPQSSRPPRPAARAVTMLERRSTGASAMRSSTRTSAASCSNRTRRRPGRPGLVLEIEVRGRLAVVVARWRMCQRHSKNASAGQSKNTSLMVARRPPDPGCLSSDIRLGRDYPPVCPSWHGVSGAYSD